jgi:hypothetical protein
MDVDTIKYEFTVTDPTAYTRPWTAVLPLTRIHEPIFEYDCHESDDGVVPPTHEPRN